MKNNMIKIGGYLTLMLGFALFFTQCSTDLSGTEQEAQVSEAVTMRGAGPGTGVCTLGAGAAVTAGDLCNYLATNFPQEALSEEEIEALLYMREEEKLARDVYLKLYEKWQYFIFEPISKSEQRHMDAVGCLIDKYGLTDPVGDNPVGSFENDMLQEQYENLITSGVESLEAALTAGATIEDLDLSDLKQAVAETNNADITAVFNNLIRGSGNHLRAFVTHLNRLGIDYEPVYLSPEEFEAVITSTAEPGSLFCDECPYCGINNQPLNRNGRRLNGRF
jgi:hypothetical protein